MAAGHPPPPVGSEGGGRRPPQLSRIGGEWPQASGRRPPPPHPLLATLPLPPEEVAAEHPFSRGEGEAWEGGPREEGVQITDNPLQIKAQIYGRLSYMIQAICGYTSRVQQPMVGLRYNFINITPRFVVSGAPRIQISPPLQKILDPPLTVYSPTLAGRLLRSREI